MTAIHLHSYFYVLFTPVIFIFYHFLHDALADLLMVHGFNFLALERVGGQLALGGWACVALGWLVLFFIPLFWNLNKRRANHNHKSILFNRLSNTTTTTTTTSLVDDTTARRRDHHYPTTGGHLSGHLSTFNEPRLLGRPPGDGASPGDPNHTRSLDCRRNPNLLLLMDGARKMLTRILLLFCVCLFFLLQNVLKICLSGDWREEGEEGRHPPGGTSSGGEHVESTSLPLISTDDRTHTATHTTTSMISLLFVEICVLGGWIPGLLSLFVVQQQNHDKWCNQPRRRNSRSSSRSKPHHSARTKQDKIRGGNKEDAKWMEDDEKVVFSDGFPRFDNGEEYSWTDHDDEEEEAMVHPFNDMNTTESDERKFHRDDRRSNKSTNIRGPNKRRLLPMHILFKQLVVNPYHDRLEHTKKAFQHIWGRHTANREDTLPTTEGRQDSSPCVDNRETLYTSKTYRKQTSMGKKGTSHQEEKQQGGIDKRNNQTERNVQRAVSEINLSLINHRKYIMERELHEATLEEFQTLHSRFLKELEARRQAEEHTAQLQKRLVALEESRQETYERDDQEEVQRIQMLQDGLSLDSPTLELVSALEQRAHKTKQELQWWHVAMRRLEEQNEKLREEVEDLIVYKHSAMDSENAHSSPIPSTAPLSPRPIDATRSQAGIVPRFVHVDPRHARFAPFQSMSEEKSLRDDEEKGEENSKQKKEENNEGREHNVEEDGKNMEDRSHKSFSFSSFRDFAASSNESLSSFLLSLSSSFAASPQLPSVSSSFSSFTPLGLSSTTPSLSSSSTPSAVVNSVFSSSYSSQSDGNSRSLRISSISFHDSSASPSFSSSSFAALDSFSSGGAHEEN